MITRRQARLLGLTDGVGEGKETSTVAAANLCLASYRSSLHARDSHPESAESSTSHAACTSAAASSLLSSWTAADDKEFDPSNTRSRRASASAFIHALSAQQSVGRRGRQTATATATVGANTNGCETATPQRFGVFPSFTMSPSMAQAVHWWHTANAIEGKFTIDEARPLHHETARIARVTAAPAITVEGATGAGNDRSDATLSTRSKHSNASSDRIEGEHAALRPGTRVTGPRAKTAWHACVRELTTQHPASTPDRLKLTLQHSTPKPSMGSGAAGSSSNGTRQGQAHFSHADMWAAKRRRLGLLQAALAYEVPHEHHLAAHKERMRLLFHPGDGDDGSTEGVHRGGKNHANSGNDCDETNLATTTGEAAYLKLLSPSHSEKEANILRVVSAVDSRLKARLRAIYQERLEEGETEEEEEERSAGAREQSPQRTGPSLWPSSPSTQLTSFGVGARNPTVTHPLYGAIQRPRLRPLERLEIVDALVACATKALPAFNSMLMGYQQEGVRWLLHLNFCERMNGILADDMGLGKTAQSVVYMAVYKIIVEELVERQLVKLVEFTRQAVQRCWPWASSSNSSNGSRSTANKGGSGSASAVHTPHAKQTAVTATIARVRELVAAVLSESGHDGVVLPALRELWPMLSRSGGRTDIAEHEDGGGALETVDARQLLSSSISTSITATNAVQQALLRELRPYLAAIRALKQVKQWIWQLDSSAEAGDGKSSEGEDSEEDDVSKSSGKDNGKRSTTAVSGGATASASRAVVQEALGTKRGSAPASAPYARRRAAPGQSALPPRKRGRPSKADLAARAAAAAAAAATTVAMGVQSKGLTCSSVLSTKEAAEAKRFLSSALAIAGVSRATNASLEKYTPMLPILIIAPLSTLPHWRKEFDHFAVSELFEVRVLNGSREGRDAETQQFLRHVRLRDGIGSHDSDCVADSPLAVPAKSTHMRASAARGGSRRVAVAAENGSTSMQDRDTQARADTLMAKTPVLIIPHDLLVRQGLSATQRRIAHAHYHLVVIDEAQRIKSSQGSLFHRVCRLSSRSRLALTGTPLQNDIVEVFSLLQFLVPAAFHGKDQRNLLEQLNAALIEASRSCALEDVELHVLLCRRVHGLLSPFILRRDKSVVKAMLPIKRDFTVVCPLTPYQSMKLAEVEAAYRDGSLSGSPNILRRKILLHPYTLLPYFYVDDGLLKASGKLLVLDFMMRFLQRTGHKFLVFCGWTLVLDVVETLCQARHVPYVRLDGKTSVEDRETHIASFNAVAAEASQRGKGRGSRHPTTISSVSPASSSPSRAVSTPPPPCCFLISKVAGGVGLNLQSADTVFLLDVDYNPQRDHQALSRVYRVGQRREVRVYRLLIDHETERGVLTIHTAKESLERAVVQAGKYDLHTSADEKEAALQQLFAGRTGQAMASRGAADALSMHMRAGENGAEKEEEREPVLFNGLPDKPRKGWGRSPVSPCSPIFPFGPPSDNEETRDEDPASPTTTGCVPRGLTPLPLTNASVPSPPSDAAKSNTTRRVRFALPDEKEQQKGMSTEETVTSPVSSGHIRMPIGEVPGILKRSREPDAKRAVDGDDAWTAAAAASADGPPPARHILSLRACLSRALPRTPEESAVLADMFTEAESEAEGEEGQRRSQRCRVRRAM